jgi:5-methyltetrahydropteroyltriglutamate--homocysteine methyltransferase
MAKAYFINKVLATTVVGSYPVGKGGGLFDPHHAAVETAVAEQIAAGIDIISDGQIRRDMIGTLASKLPGIKGQDVIGKVQPAAGPITAGDTRSALSRTPKVKGIITGPTTLAHALHLATPMYRNKEELALVLAVALAAEAKSLEATGVTLIQIDEPMFSTGVADLDIGKLAVELIAKSLAIPSCMHVCGELSGVIDRILDINVNVFDFEFSKNPGNLDLFRSRDLAGRMIGLGCVDSTTDRVETVAEIRARIEERIGVFGPGAMLIDPDCGMRMRTREAASAKLNNMAVAAKEARLAL